MASTKQINSEILFIKSFQLIMQAYEEISTMKMKKIRESVINSRQFLDGLASVYVNVKTSYKKRVDELLSKGGKSKESRSELAALTAYKKNGKSLLVFISANTKLYGDIMLRVFEKFKIAAARGGADIMIIGRLGRELFLDSGLGKKFLYFEVPDIDLKPEDLRQIVYHLIQYDSVTIFHGRFENIVTQEPYIATISGDPFFKQATQPVDKSQPYLFLFEPSLEKILGFFETQVFTSLFQQSVYESALARFASRIRAMEQSLEKIEGIQKGLTRSHRQAVRTRNNKMQSEKLAGIHLWSR